MKRQRPGKYPKKSRGTIKKGGMWGAAATSQNAGTKDHAGKLKVPEGGTLAHPIRERGEINIRQLIRIDPKSFRRR